MATLAELNNELIKLSRELGEALVRFEEACGDYARTENDYRHAKAVAYLKSEGTVDARKAQVDIACGKERLDAHIAEGLKESSRERVRGLIAQLSALQSVAASTRAELESLDSQDHLGLHDQPPFDPESGIPF